jgi:phosphopantothenoylcysteine decarboxylase/phosphopantothenate--cysteine ligase
MHPNMWFNEATQANVRTLRARGIDVMEPVEGALTSGDVGKGRFPSTSEIINRFTGSTLREQDLAQVKVLVTAGGTREALDPVRFIGNKSTGKQGLAIAEAALARGADVTLLMANSELPSHPEITRVNVESVEDMQSALLGHYADCDILFMAAAISDVRPATKSVEKIKKGNLSSIALAENPDLLASLTADSAQKVIVAFAAETDKKSIEMAQEKMARKGATLIYLNDVSDGAIFGSDHTSGFIIDSTGVLEECVDISKENLAHALINQAISKSHKLG